MAAPRGGGSRRSSPLLAVAVFAVCLCLYLLAESVGRREERRPWHWMPAANKAYNQVIMESRQLAKVLKKAAMDDNTVIITILNSAWAAPNSMLDLFLESFHIGEETERLLRYLVIVAMDLRAFDQCKAVHPQCFFLKTEGVDFTVEKRFMTEDYLKMMWRRIDFLKTVLQLGYSFVFTDLDVMWFRNPFSKFTANAHVTIACDFFRSNSSSKSNWANGGFLYVKSNEVAIEFYKYWYLAGKQHPGLHDQAVFNKIKEDEIVRQMGVRITFLDTAYFGGFCQPSKDLNKVCTMHANCCVGIEKKLHDLRILLDDWRSYKAARPAEKTKLEGSFTWRVPLKCKA